MYKFPCVSILLVLILLISAGCSSSANNTSEDISTVDGSLENNYTVKESSNYENDIMALLKKTLEETDFNLESLDIREINSFENSTFVQFLVENNNLNEGLACIEKEDSIYKLVEIDVAETDLNTPFTRHILSFSLNNGRNCRLIGGCINNDDIEEIRLEYKDNTVKVIKIGVNQDTYLEYIVGDVDSLQTISGYDQNNEVTYTYE